MAKRIINNGDQWLTFFWKSAERIRFLDEEMCFVDDNDGKLLKK